jgi:ribosomal protein S18 acetylase RimI-like enzyme
MGTVRKGTDPAADRAFRSITIRAWRETDLSAVARLYYETVHRINIRDYTAVQVQAWAPEPWPDTFWRERFQGYRVFIAEQQGQLVGFAEFDPRNGHIDCFYVHHARQHRGIGKALMQEILQAAKGADIDRLHADVSLTASVFFEAMGFVLLEERLVPYRGEIFRQFKMERILTGMSDNGSRP